MNSKLIKLREGLRKTNEKIEKYKISKNLLKMGAAVSRADNIKNEIKKTEEEIKKFDVKFNAELLVIQLIKIEREIIMIQNIAQTSLDQSKMASCVDYEKFLSDSINLSGRVNRLKIEWENIREKLKSHNCENYLAMVDKKTNKIEVIFI